MSELSDIIKNWNTDILEDDDRVYDSKVDINRLIKVIPLLGEGVIQMKTSTRNLMINGLPLDGKLYKGTGSVSSGVVEVVPEGTDYVYHMAKSGTTQGVWSISSTDSSSISQIPYVKDDGLFANTLIKGSGTVTMQFLDKDNSILSEMTTPVLTDSYQAFSVKGQLKDSVWSFKIIASDDVYFKELMITRSSFPSDYMLSEEELEQLNIINTSDIDANTVAKSHAYQVIGLKNCPPNVSTSGLFINIQKDNFAQVFVPNTDAGIYYRVGVTTDRPNTKWIRLATSDNTYSKEDFTEMRTSDNINLIQDSSMSAGFWTFAKEDTSTSVGSLNTAEGIAHITGNGTSGTSWAQYYTDTRLYAHPLLQNSEIQYDQEYTASVETSWSEGSDIASNDVVPPTLIVRESYKNGTSKNLIQVKAVDKYGHDKWHKLSGTFKFSEDRKNDISFIQVALIWQGAKGDVYFRRPKLEMASLPSAYNDDPVVSVEPNHNLLQDSRDLLDGWIKNGSKVSLDATGDMAWYQGMRVQHQFGDWSYYGTTKTPILENGKYYTVSAYMRGLSEADINMYATILSDKSNSSIINFPLAKHLTGEWKRYSYTFKFDANTQVANTSAIRVEGQGDWASNGGSVYVAGIKLEEGKTATDWSPSIEETIVRYETQNWQKDKITGDDGGLALRINVSGTDSMEEQFLSATGTKTFYLQGGATGNNTGDSLRGILLKDTPTNGNAYGISSKNELWFLKIEDSKLTTWSKIAKDADVMAIKDEEIDFRHSDMLKKTFETMRKRGDFYDNEFAGRSINIKWFGAVGDGVTDDTKAVQDAIDSLGTTGGTILIPNGVYMIKADAPEQKVATYLLDAGGISVPSNTTINLAPGAELKAIPTDEGAYNILRLVNVHDVVITGGKITGERDLHTPKIGPTNTVGEWGYGIELQGSSNVIIRDITLRDLWGDGINIQAGIDGKTICQNVTIDNVICDNNRRQGMSIEALEHGLVRNSIFKNTVGTAPACGIDLEPAYDVIVNNDILIENNQFLNNDNCGLLVTRANCNKQIKVKDNYFVGNSGKTLNGQLYAQNGNDILIENNDFLGNDSCFYGISVNHFNGVNVINNRLKDAGFVSLSVLTDSVIDSNQFIMTKLTNGVTLLTHDSDQRIIIRNNLFNSLKVPLPTADFPDHPTVYFRGDSLEIVNNTLINQAFGIFATCSSSRIEGNQIHASHYSGISINGASVDIVNNVVTGAGSLNGDAEAVGASEAIVIGKSAINNYVANNIIRKESADNYYPDYFKSTSNPNGKVPAHITTAIILDNKNHSKPLYTTLNSNHVYGDYIKPYALADINFQDGLAFLSQVVGAGASNKRPGDAIIGSVFFDTTLGKPIFCKLDAVNGGTQVWVDSTGTKV